jgi:hypothetical protein
MRDVIFCVTCNTNVKLRESNWRLLFVRKCLSKSGEIYTAKKYRVILFRPREFATSVCDLVHFPFYSYI